MMVPEGVMGWGYLGSNFDEFLLLPIMKYEPFLGFYDYTSERILKIQLFYNSKENKMKLFRKFKWSISLAILVALLVVGVVLAANTPAWWDNPGSTYSTWVQLTDSGTFTNNQISAIQASVFTDVPIACTGGASQVATWAQIEWTVTSGSGSVVTTNFSKVVERTTDACPASSSDTFPATNYGFAFMTEQGSFTPEFLANGLERSYTDNGTPGGLPSCERVQTSWLVDPLSSINYRVEVQAVCLSPTAITLRNLEVTNSSTSIYIALVAGLAAILGGAIFVAIKRRRTA